MIRCAPKQREGLGVLGLWALLGTKGQARAKAKSDGMGRGARCTRRMADGAPARARAAPKGGRARAHAHPHDIHEETSADGRRARALAHGTLENPILRGRFPPHSFIKYRKNELKNPSNHPKCNSAQPKNRKCPRRRRRRSGINPKRAALLWGCGFVHPFLCDYALGGAPFAGRSRRRCSPRF